MSRVAGRLGRDPESLGGGGDESFFFRATFHFLPQLQHKSRSLCATSQRTKENQIVADMQIDIQHSRRK